MYVIGKIKYFGLLILVDCKLTITGKILALNQVVLYSAQVDIMTVYKLHWGTPSSSVSVCLLTKTLNICNNYDTIRNFIG